MTIADPPLQSFDLVRDRVLAEHTELRRLLQRLLVAARSIIERETTFEIELHAAITAVALTFDQHFWMEEKHLIPLLAATGEGGGPGRPHRLGDGPVQAALMLDEHRQQREIVFALLSEAIAGEKAGIALAEDACWLVDSLMKDIHEEDQFLLGLDGGASRTHASRSAPEERDAAT